MLLGYGSGLITKGKEKEGQAKIMRYMTIMDSMIDAGEWQLFESCFVELGSTNSKVMNES